MPKPLEKSRGFYFGYYIMRFTSINNKPIDFINILVIGSIGMGNFVDYIF